MKITEVRVYIIPSARLHPVLVEVVTDQGIRGCGEAGIAYGLGSTAVAGMLRDIAERFLIGADPFRIEALWSTMYDHTFWAKGGGPIVFGAISAIEQALWDIKGKATGLPAYEMLGGKIRDDVRLYCNGWGQEHRNVAPFAAAAERAVAEGYDALKCYPFAYREDHPQATSRHPLMRTLSREALRLGLEKMRALRAAVGPDIDLMADLSGGLSCDETLRFCHKLEDLDLFFIEEPCDPFDVGTLKKIAAALKTPLAVGERLYTRYGFRPVFESHAVGIVQPDLCLVGGLMEGKKIAAMAEAYSMRVQPHICGSPVATAVALQLCACIPNFAILEIYPYWQDMPGYVEFTDDPPERRIHKGRLTIPDTPGLGINLVQNQVASYLWAAVT